MTDFTRHNRILAAIIGGIALLLYGKTMAPTTTFWDCGEFIACSYTMGVPHPPGSPMFIMIGRVFTLIPFGDIGWRVNLLSVLATAATIALTYLIIVRLVRQWHGEPRTAFDAGILMAGGALGALTFMTTTTLWFNAVEAEVYALSMLLTALAFWLALVWMDAADAPRSARYLVLIAYLFGFAIGVHLLNVLALPAILMIVFFRKPRMLIRMDLMGISALLVLVACTCYLMVLIRSGLDPAIDQNNPENWQNFLAYMRRDQYGTESLFTTIFDRKAPFWDYQVKKMFLRYFGWNFIGRGDTIGAGSIIMENFTLRGIWGVPCFMGLFGMVYHFSRDWRRALSVLFLFIMTGIAIIIYLNQPDPQPRERDYVFVGCYFAFALWIGIGVSGFFEMLADAMRNRTHLLKPLGITALVAMLLALPVTMGAFNYHKNDRTGDYVAWDYSYNILQSCEQNAILVTNGDNDTFPLWYLQEVEHIRRDVTVVNLSLANTSWYNIQLKHQHGVPISMTDEQIRNTPYLIMEKPQDVSITLGPGVNKIYMKELEGLRPFPTEDVEMKWVISPTLQGKALRLQDLIILNIIQTNRFKRPIYFAITVGDNGLIGLKRYLRMDGMAYKLVTSPQEATRNLVPEILGPAVLETMRFRGTNDPAVHHDAPTQGLLRNYRTVFLKLAYAYYLDAKYDDMIVVLDRLEEVLPEAVLPMRNMDYELQVGQFYWAGGRKEELQKMVDRNLTREGLTAANMISLAKTCQSMLNDPEKASQAYARALTLEPGNRIAYQGLVPLLEARQEHTRLVTVLETWLQTSPNDTNARQKLAQYRNALSPADSAQ